jgi:hypothetical protein
MKKLLIPFFLFLVAIAACKKDEPPAVVEETPLTSFIADSTVHLSRIGIFSLVDVGFSFQALKPGKITKVSVIPDKILKTVYVTIWDVAAKKSVVRKMIEVTTANRQQIWADITPLVIEPLKEYRIVLEDRVQLNRYVSSKVRGTPLLPLVKGNIKILKNVVSKLYQTRTEIGTFPEPFSTDDPKIIYNHADFAFIAD